LDKSSSSKSVPSVQQIVLLEICWAVLALLFFLLFSQQLPGQSRPVWYSVGTSIFEAIAYLAAAGLCLRNWRSPQIVSGRNVWLGIGLGMFCYFVGSILFSIWETGLQLEADVSPGDFFFVLTYIFLIWGMVLAVTSRRLNLEIWQWGVVTAIAALGIVIAGLVSAPTAQGSKAFLIQPVMAQIAPASAQPAPKPSAKANPKATAKHKPAAQPASPSATSTTAPSAEKKSPLPAPPETPTPAAVEQKSHVPEWAIAIGETLKPLKPLLDWYYVVSDVALLIIATTLLLAFWGGRFSQSWRMIAAAAFCFYIADIWFKYASNPKISGIPHYQSGGVLEVFWVFAAVLLGIGAALEHDLSSRSRSRTGGRKRPSAS